MHAQQGPFAAAGQQQALSQPTPGPFPPQGPFGASSQQQPYPHPSSAANPAAAPHLFQGPFGEPSPQQPGPRSSDLPPGPFGNPALQQAFSRTSSLNQAPYAAQQAAVDISNAHMGFGGNPAVRSSPLQSSLYTTSAWQPQVAALDDANNVEPHAAQGAHAALHAGSSDVSAQQEPAFAQQGHPHHSEPQQQQYQRSPALGWASDFLNHHQQQQQMQMPAPRPLEPSPFTAHRSIGHSSVSSGTYPWQDPRFSLDTQGNSLSSRPASFDVAVQQAGRQDVTSAAYAGSASRSPAYTGDVHFPTARVPVDPGPSSEYVSPFAAMDPLAPFPSTALSGEHLSSSTSLQLPQIVIILGIIVR